jgi:hypothetical protein
MAFKPNPEQRRIIEDGSKWLEEANEPGRPPYSMRFVEKCTEEMGIRFKPKPRVSRLAKFATSVKKLITGLLSRFLQRKH